MYPAFPKAPGSKRKLYSDSPIDIFPPEQWAGIISMSGTVGHRSRGIHLRRDGAWRALGLDRGDGAGAGGGIEAAGGRAGANCLTQLNRDLCAILKHTGSPMLTTAFYLVADRHGDSALRECRASEAAVMQPGSPAGCAARQRDGKSRPALGLV